MSGWKKQNDWEKYIWMLRFLFYILKESSWRKAYVQFPISSILSLNILCPYLVCLRVILLTPTHYPCPLFLLSGQLCWFLDPGNFSGKFVTLISNCTVMILIFYHQIWTHLSSININQTFSYIIYINIT